MKKLLFLLALCCVSVSIGQTVIKARNGAFESIHKWGEGYMGIAHETIDKTKSKYKMFQYFNKAGKMLWESRINLSYDYYYPLVHEDNDYVYLLNEMYGREQHVTKDSRTGLFKIYRVDKKGEVKEFDVDYIGEFARYKGKRNIGIEYLSTYKNQIVMVVRAPNQYMYELFKLDEEMNVVGQNMKFNFDKDAWKDTLVGQLKFLHKGNQLTAIQVKKERTNDTLHFISETYNLDSLQPVNQVINSYEVDPKNLAYESSACTDWSTDHGYRFNTYSYYSEKRGEDVFLLGSFFNYYEYQSTVYAVGQLENAEGYFYFKLNTKESSVLPDPTERKFQNWSEKVSVNVWTMAANNLSYTVNYGKSYATSKGGSENLQKGKYKSISLEMLKAISGKNILGDINKVLSVQKTPRGALVVEIISKPDFEQGYAEVKVYDVAF